jgi:hypothetical protein
VPLELRTCGSPGPAGAGLPLKTAADRVKAEVGANRLEGSLQRSGNRVRFNAQLIDAETDTHLWAERFDGDTRDLFALQDEVTSRIAVALNLELLSAEAARRTEHPDALEFILRARAAGAKPPGGVPGASFAEIIERCQAYKAEAQVDVICPNGLRTWEEIQEAIRLIPGGVCCAATGHGTIVDRRGTDQVRLVLPPPRAEARGHLSMLDREIRLAGPQPEKTADVPATREARIEGEGAIDRCDHRIQVFAEHGERHCGVGQNRDPGEDRFTLYADVQYPHRVRQALATRI